jgi:hypothetical protein
MTSKEELMPLIMRACADFMSNVLSKEITWTEYKGNSTICTICNISIIEKDKVGKLDCPCLFHTTCIYRYCDRVKSVCPVCNTPVLDRFAKIQEVAKDKPLIQDFLKSK